MRYFKYKNTNKTYQNALKEHYTAMTSDEQLIVRKRKRWHAFSSIISLTILIILLIPSISFLSKISLPDSIFWMILVCIAELLASFIIFIICGVITITITTPLWRKVDSFHLPLMKKKFLSESCRHLRKYYGLKEPYIITKCFDATDKKFKNHDVCIFIVGEEIRITTDLINGFLHGERDLGSYAFKREEIILSKSHIQNHLVTKLREDSTVFILGYRAKRFIDKNFLVNTEP